MASRAFAFYYFAQALVATRLALKDRAILEAVSFTLLALLMLGIFIFAKAVEA